MGGQGSLWSGVAWVGRAVSGSASRSAYESVWKVSWKLRPAGEIAASITVRLEPPRLSSSRWVSFDERYGMCPLALASVRALMTLPSAERLWLMAIASLRVSPVAPVLEARSEPARSTRLIFEFTFFLPRPAAIEAANSCSTRMMTTACERDDSAFILVDATARRLLPDSISAVSSSALRSGRSVSPCT